MNKTVAIKLSAADHERFVSACVKTGVRRQHFVKVAVLEKVDRVNKENDETVPSGHRARERQK